MNIRLFFSFFTLISITAHAVVHISEIINNTDAQLILKKFQSKKSYGSFGGISIISSELLTGKKCPPYTIDGNRGDNGILRLAPRTKNIIIGLEMPKRNPLQFGDSYILELSILSGSNPSRRMIGFNQIGELFQIIGKYSHRLIRNIIINGENIKINQYPQILGKKMIDNAYYSISINQVVENLNNLGSFDFIFNQIEIPKQEEFANTAKAYIDQFSSGNSHNGIVNALIRLDSLTTESFFQKFYKLLEENEFIKKLAIVHKNNIDQSISFQFYTNITREEFQNLLDQANQQIFKS
ncbi:hypothetical protein M1446_05690 [Candidatus Dependentiae bacterium]|nr:hypothetical protein [Candidatus Dependentiae bacterium]